MELVDITKESCLDMELVDITKEFCLDMKLVDITKESCVVDIIKVMSSHGTSGY